MANNPRNIPTAARPIITKPIGTFEVKLPVGSEAKVGITRGGGGVYVGNLVGAMVTTNCAAIVGSIVVVTKGVGMAGGSTIGRTPGVILTRDDEIQPTPPGIPS
jgi:hypothetical protein